MPSFLLCKNTQPSAEEILKNRNKQKKNDKSKKWKKHGEYKKLQSLKIRKIV